MDDPEHLDVVVVGAGLAGIGAACRIRAALPDRSLVVLEARAATGGTWDLFRYPGVRSDSDMFTLGYPFRAWRRPEAFADGAAIREYIRQTATDEGIDPLIRLGQRVVSADWSWREARWTVQVLTDGGPRTYTCDFLHVCCGYYDYDRGHDPQIPGLDGFHGPVVHPQFWPEDLDVEAKRVVVVGSGATAVTLVPALAQRAGHVVMLQRSPTYIVARPSSDRVAVLALAGLPPGAAHRVVRWKNVLVGLAFYQFCRNFPRQARQVLEAGAAHHLPTGYDVPRDFSPRYSPWDERLCASPDGDLFRAIRSGPVSVVTDRIERVAADRIHLVSGGEVPADVIVLATGLRLEIAGGVRLSIEGEHLDASELLMYRGLMFGGVPNLATAIGYTNASWTLRTDLAVRYVVRLMRALDRYGYAWAVPVPPPGMRPRPLLGLSSGYIQRAAGQVPHQGSRAPWYLLQNYLVDAVSMRAGRLGRDMAFGRRGQSPRATVGRASGSRGTAS